MTSGTVQGGSYLLMGILNALPFGIFWKDPQLAYLGCNEAYARHLGLTSPADVVGKTDEDFLPAERAARSRKSEMAMVEGSTSLTRMPEGSGGTGDGPAQRTICRSLLREGDGKIIGLAGYIEDPSALAPAGSNGHNAVRARTLLHLCTTCMLGAANEMGLLNDLCALIIGAGYRMAWFGRVEKGTGKTIRPIACGGFSENYLDSLHVTWDDVPLGRGPTGTAVRERRTVVNQNFMTNPAMLPWRAAAIAQGFHASIAIPMMYRDEVLSVLTIYATEPDAFDAGEVELLEELARNISIGLAALREHSRRLAELAAANEALANLARRDELTGLPNRLAANERLELEFVTMKRTRRSYAILMMDIDHFKRVNDSHGHVIGDRVLSGIGRVMQRTIRKRDFVCRFGGEEFLAILPETGIDGAVVVAEKLRGAVSGLVDPDAGQVTLSVGVAIASFPDQTEDDAIRLADQHLYEAKSLGRNLVVS